MNSGSSCKGCCPRKNRKRDVLATISAGRWPTIRSAGASGSRSEDACRRNRDGFARSRRDVRVAFGLIAHERDPAVLHDRHVRVHLGLVHLLAAHGDARDVYLEALRREQRVDVDAAIRDGLLRIVAGPGTDAAGALAFWGQAMSEVLAAGPTLIRVVGEMVSERTVFPSDDEMIRYEVAYNLIAKRFPTVTLCQYDVRAFGGETVFDALQAHPDLYDLGLASFLV